MPVTHRRKTVRPNTAVWPWLAALAGLVALVYVPLLDADFLSWDDRAHLHDNPWLWPPESRNVSQLWREPFWGEYVPVTYTFWALIAGLAEGHDSAGQPSLAPGPFHAANIVLHLGVVCLVFHLLRQFGQRPRPAFLAAALFAVHPLQVETVAWISECRGLLATLWALLAWHSYRAAVQFDATQQTGLASSPTESSAVARPATIDMRRYALGTGCLVLALLAKSSAVALPVMLAAWVACCDPRRWWLHTRALAPWFTIAASMSVLMKFLQPARETAEIVALWQRPLVALDTVAFYTSKLMWPIGLTIDYGRRPEVVLNAGLTTIVSGAFTLIALTLLAATAVVARSWRSTLCGVALFVTGIAPVLGLLPFEFQRISTVADRYVYLAMFGAAWLTAELISRGELRWRRTPLVAGVIVAALALLSHGQARHWHDDVTLFEQTLRVNPQSSVALANLGYVHQQRGQLDEAARYYRATLEVAPQDVIALKGLGEIALAQGDLPTAANRFEQAMRCQPQDAGAWNNWGATLAAQGQFAEAERRFRRAIELASPPRAEFHVNLARAFAAQNQLEPARSEVRRALSIAPQDASAQELARQLAR